MRRYYEIELGNPPLPAAAGGLQLRPVRSQDEAHLAALMLDAYVGTIDYEGEGYDEARAEVAGYLGDAPLLGHSFVATDGGLIVSAVLVTARPEVPLIGYVMTAAARKRQGLARLVVATALRSLGDGGYRRVGLWTTAGNEASERLFSSLGAELVEPGATL